MYMHKKKVSGAPVRYVAVCWSPWLYVHSCTHTAEHTRKQGEISDCEGSGVANVLLTLLGRYYKRKL